TAENVADQYGVDRQAQDEFALLSQERAKAAIARGEFKEQIVAVDGFDTDEYPRETSIEALAKLKPVFKKDGSVTAGNSSGRNDGAGAVIVMGREKADELGYDYYLRHVATSVAAIDPRIMGVGPIEASKEALEKAGLSIKDISLIELNEAFASQSIAVMREWAKWGEESFEEVVSRTNVNGGAISMGHPMGATGIVLTTKLFYEMKKHPEKQYGMVTMCIGGGMGLASIFEQCRR
ncbi:MAG: thiolase family protein, partial [Lachnospiraceae bacterium]|nr:thiolase family protein [Lachnospiraceae bacterium]